MLRDLLKKMLFAFFLYQAMPAFADRIAMNTSLYPGSVVRSDSGAYALVLQNDGNLVMYRVADGKALWSTGTTGRGTVRADLQTDGNFVLYNANNTPLWATDNHPALPFAIVQDDGNFAIYGRRTAWNTNTAVSQSAVSGGYALLANGGALEPGSYLMTASGKFKFSMQTDGNLVLYRTTDGKALWWSNTTGRCRCRAVMQSDGNFVLYDVSTNQAIWSTRTTGIGNSSYLAVQEDGNVVIYYIAAYWSSLGGYVYPPLRKSGTSPTFGVGVKCTYDMNGIQSCTGTGPQSELSFLYGQ
jgi:hypothetical protein